jgi:type IV pilus assembly protein PilB
MRKDFYPISMKMLGQILVEENIISPIQLQSALDRQKNRKGKYKYIGEILIEMGLPHEKINRTLDVYAKRRPTGQILLDLKVITPGQLEKALEKQARLAAMGIRKPLAKLMFEMGFTTHEECLDVLSKHFNMPIVSLINFSPSRSLQGVFGHGYAEKHRIVVLGNYPKKIKLALAEPNPLTMDELRRSLPPGKEIEFYLAHPFEMDRCLRMKSDPFALSYYR